MPTFVPGVIFPFSMLRAGLSQCLFMIRFFLFLAVALTTARSAEDWPRFLGPEGNAHTAAKGLPLEWSEKKNVKWKTPLPGEGWSSPVVGGGRVYCTTALDDGLSLRALSIDVVTGKILWDVEVFKNAAPPVKHKRNSHASPTPWLEGDRLYVTFGHREQPASRSRTAQNCGRIGS